MEVKNKICWIKGDVINKAHQNRYIEEVQKRDLEQYPNYDIFLNKWLEDITLDELNNLISTTYNPEIKTRLEKIKSCKLELEFYQSIKDFTTECKKIFR